MDGMFPSGRTKNVRLIYCQATGDAERITTDFLGSEFAQAFAHFTVRQAVCAFEMRVGSEVAFDLRYNFPSSINQQPFSALNAALNAGKSPSHEGNKINMISQSPLKYHEKSH
jgi:hypothetical protein